MFSFGRSTNAPPKLDPLQNKLLKQLDEIKSMESAVFQIPENPKPSKSKDRTRKIVEGYKAIKKDHQNRYQPLQTALQQLRDHLIQSKVVCDVSSQALESSLSRLSYALAAIVSVHPPPFDERSMETHSRAQEIVGSHNQDGEEKKLEDMYNEYLKNGLETIRKGKKIVEIEHKLTAKGSYLYEVNIIVKEVVEKIQDLLSP